MTGNFNAGGYDHGYAACSCFWGNAPSSLIQRLDRQIPSWKTLTVLDAGCGEGKNASFVASRGASVTAFDISELAIKNAIVNHRDEKGITWGVHDALTYDFSNTSFDVVIAYGLYHCLSSPNKIGLLIDRLKSITKSGGYNVVCCFNDRAHDLRAHPGFNPTLLPHQFYLDAYGDWEILESTDSDLEEVHPNNQIRHKHSLTRIIARMADGLSR